MVAAYTLARAGHRVSLFERSQVLGGLAGGFTIGGANLEKAYHHLFTSDTDMIALATELGLKDELLYCKNKTAMYANGRLFRFGSALDLSRFTPLPFFHRLRFGIVTFSLQHVSNWRGFITIPAVAWIKKWYGPKAYAVVWEPLLKGKFHHYAKDISMAWLWARIHVRANSKHHGREAVVYFKNGFQILINALEKRLDSLGVEIHYHAAIQSITSPDARPTLTMADGSRDKFDAMICTVPSHTFLRITKHESRPNSSYWSHLEQIHYLGAVLLVFSSPQSLSRAYWHNINDLSSPFLVFLQHTNLVDKATYGGQHVYYLGTYLPHEHRYFSDPEQSLYREFFAGLKKIFPEFQEDAIHEKYLFRFKNAQHIVDTNYETKIPSYETPLPNVYLANFSQIFPEDRGTNFAVREGMKIAKLVEKSFS